jgi:hypothetical protein
MLRVSDQWVDCFNTMCFPWGEDEPGCDWRLYPSAPHHWSVGLLNGLWPPWEGVTHIPNLTHSSAHTNARKHWKHFNLKFECTSQTYNQSATCIYKIRLLLCTRKNEWCHFFGEVHLLAAFPPLQSLASNRVHANTGIHRWKAKQTNTASTKRLAESVLSGAITAGTLYCSRLLKYPRNNDRALYEKRERHLNWALI